MTQNPKRFRHRTAEVEAVQWTGSNADEMRAFCSPFDFQTIDSEDRVEDPDKTAAMRESKHGTWLGMAPGDWAVKIGDEYYELSAADFKASFEPAATSPQPDRVTAIYDAIDAFQRQFRTVGGLQHAQIRASLAEYLDRELPAAVVPVSCAAPDQTAEAIASCPGRELSPNPCRCPCYGCKHHCAAHDPDSVAVLPTGDRAALEAERDSLGREADRLRKDWVEMRARAERAEADQATVLLWAADRIDAETRQLKAHGVLEPDRYRPCRDASAQLRRLAAEAQPEPETEALRAKVDEATATLRRIRSTIRTLKDQGATGRAYYQAITDDLAGPHPDQPAPAAGVRQPDTETREAEAHPPTHTWKVESPRRDKWASWGATHDERVWAAASFEDVIEVAPQRAFRLVRATTTYVVEAEHTPTPAVSGRPAPDDSGEGEAEGGPLPTLRERHRAAWNALTPAERDARIAALDAAEEEADRG